MIPSLPGQLCSFWRQIQIQNHKNSSYRDEAPGGHFHIVRDRDVRQSRVRFFEQKYPKGVTFSVEICEGYHSLMVCFSKLWSAKGTLQTLSLICCFVLFVVFFCIN